MVIDDHDNCKDDAHINSIFNFLERLGTAYLLIHLQTKRIIIIMSQ